MEPPCDAGQPVVDDELQESPLEPLAERALSGIEPSFIENLGQAGDPDVRFYAKGKGLSVGLRPGGVTFVVSTPGTAPSDEMGVPGARRTSTFTMSFAGCDPVKPVGNGTLGHRTNYMLGGEPTRWVHQARSFSEVFYSGLYPGIDLRFRFKDGELKYDYIVQGGADASSIRQQYDGIRGLSVDSASQDLMIRTADIIMRDRRPVFFQDGASSDAGMPGLYLLLGGDAAAFAVPEGIATDREYIIDPGLVYSTLLGSFANEYISCVIADEHDNCYVSGRTDSLYFPTTNDSYDPVGPDIGTTDGFIVRFNGTWSLVDATFLGGSSSDQVNQIRPCSDGTVICGVMTYSSDFPTSGSENGTFNGKADTVLVEMSADLSELLRTRFVGGTSWEWLYDMGLAADGAPTMVMLTYSDDLETTPGAFCSTFEGRSSKDFPIPKSVALVRANRELNVTYCTYINWLTGSHQGRLSMALDRTGCVYVSFITDVQTLPPSVGGYCPVYNGGESDCMVLKFDLRGGGPSDLLAATYLGGEGSDTPWDLEVDASGRLLIGGSSGSMDFPFTGDALSDDIKGLDFGFLAVMDGDLNDLIYSSCISGDGYVIYGFVKVGPVDGLVSVLYLTFATDLPTTEGCFDPIYRGIQAELIVDYNPYLVCFDLSTPALTYATYLGGPGYASTGFDSLACDRNGGLIIGFAPESDHYPTTADAFDREFKGGPADGLVAYLDPRPCGLPDPPSNLTAGRGDGSARIRWDPQTMWGTRVLDYRVYDISVPSTPRFLYTIPGDSNETDFRGLVNGRTYFFGVSAVNSVGEGPMAEVSVMPLGMPSAPLDVVSSTGDGSIGLRWYPPSRDGGRLLGYRVYRGLRLDEMVLVNGTARPSFDDRENVSVGTMYIYKVTAWNEVGEGPPCFVVQVAESPPGPPRSISAVPGDRSATITWASPSLDGGCVLLGYRVYRGQDGGAAQLVAEVGWASLGWTDSDLTNGVSYEYTVTARNIHGESAPTEPALVCPSGPPGPPRDLVVTSDDRCVHLSWSAPDEPNGSPVLGYNVYWGDSLERVAFKGFTNETSTDAMTLVNGRTYYFQVSTVTGFGQGQWSDLRSATPYGMPGRVNNPSIDLTAGGLGLQWSPPSEMGGAADVGYLIYRGTSQDMQPYAECPPGILTWGDSDVQPGGTYYYSISAFNPLWTGPAGDPMNMTYLLLPGTVRALTAGSRDGSVLLRWSAPNETGGASEVEYIVLRKVADSTDGLEEVSRTSGTELLDPGLVNGVRYSYAVQARNGRGTGPMSAPENATPLGMPPPPGLAARVDRGDVILTWDAITSNATVPITGYIVLRGITITGMKEVATLGDVRKYVDSGLAPGESYYYQVVPVTDRGQGEGSIVMPIELPPSPNYTVPIVLVVVLVVVAVVVQRVRSMRRASAEHGGRGLGTGAMAGQGTGPVTVDVAGRRGPSCVVEEVVVVHASGRLIASSAKRGLRDEDAALMSGMLTAVQGIVQDGFQHQGGLESIKYGENTILMVGGSHVNIAVILYGEPDERLKEAIESAVRDIETSYAGMLEQWEGDELVIAGIREAAAHLVALTEGIERKDVESPEASKGVSLHSATDFHQGYVRLKVVVMNATLELAADAAVEVDYAPDMLRLERVEPATLRLRGDRLALGNIGPGERKEVAFLFDPQICQATDIDGLLTYFDEAGTHRHVEMGRRHVEVVCPVFFTREHANTAMLRRLLKEELREQDIRGMRYPQAMEPREAFARGKGVIGPLDVRLVREYVVEGPPYEAEAWYYGETKARGHRVVMRLDVVEEKQAIELFAASTTMETVTGLLAEFRRELERAMGDRPGGAARSGARPDEGLREGLGSRVPLMERFGPDDGDGTSGTEGTRPPSRGDGGGR